MVYITTKSIKENDNLILKEGYKFYKLRKKGLFFWHFKINLEVYVMWAGSGLSSRSGLYFKQATLQNGRG